MKEIAFNIFEKEKASFWVNEQYNIIGYLLIISPLLLLFFATKYYPRTVFETVIGYFCLICLLFFIIFLIKNLFTQKPINGVFNGTIKFTKDAIEVEAEKYLIDDIAKIDLSVFDYYGRMSQQTNLDLNQVLSNGVNNFVIIHLKNGKNISVFFQIMKENDFLQMRDLLIQYHKQRMFSFLRLTQLLRIENYNDIQDLKKSIQHR